jgi:hypothetical protein
LRIIGVYPKGTRPIGLAMKKAAINAAIFLGCRYKEEGLDKEKSR